MNPNCEKCKLNNFCLNPYLTGRGNLDDPKVVLIGGAPDIEDDQNGEVFSGQVGKFLTSMLGDKLPVVWMTNALRCAPVKDVRNLSLGIRTATEFELELCRPFLLKELKALTPRK